MGNRITKIIVEGSDQQGKSTMCKYLSETLGWNIKRFGPPDSTFNFHEDYFIPNFTISDRNFLSEIVYRKMQGLDHRIISLDLLQEKMKANTLLILMDREDYFVFEDREEVFNKSQILKARGIYRDIWDSLDFNKLIINPHEDLSDFHALIKHINDSLQIPNIR